ncbi:hypothetical protein KSF_077550 [Reticulibacter mediterranei]|uniref:Uncharacterized protein n=1 Tax=Reticulibacter mediterranei TaxID=2778369 RepID=A0A8J3IVT4_9CHLR|nr:hypothetical protein KSF_077550 [Reticulibacter mediterranei]
MGERRAEHDKSRDYEMRGDSRKCYNSLSIYLSNKHAEKGDGASPAEPRRITRHKRL